LPLYAALETAELPKPPTLTGLGPARSWPAGTGSAPCQHPHDQPGQHPFQRRFSPVSARRPTVLLYPGDRGYQRITEKRGHLCHVL